MTTNTTKRADVHRPGAIVPAHYTELTCYALAGSEDGYPMPRMHVDCADPVARHDHEGRVTGYDVPTCPDSGRCCVASIERHAARDGRAIFGRAGKCGVCGARFRTGSAFRHDDGAIVHMGHDCADKYEMMYDSSAFELEAGRLQAAHAKAIARAQNESQRRAFLDAHPGLEAALALGKPQGEGTKDEAILADMAGRFVTWRELSEKQVAFAIKLADGIRNPTQVVQEKHCPAPIGKGIEFEGEIVSCKNAEGYMGAPTTKMTVKVVTADGSSWLAYGTCPSSLLECLRASSHWGGGSPSDLRGRRVAVKATLELPRQRRAGEDHFAFMSRPSAAFVDLFDHPRYQAPKCVIGQPCHIVRRAEPGCALLPMICDGRCKNVAKVAKERKPRAKKATQTEKATRTGKGVEGGSAPCRVIDDVESASPSLVSQ